MNIYKILVCENVKIVCGKVKPISSGGLKLLALHFAWSSTDASGCRYSDVANVSYQQNSTDIYQQYLLTKVATLLFCTECRETQVAISSLND